MYSTTGYFLSTLKLYGKYIVTHRSVTPSSALTTYSFGATHPTACRRLMSAAPSVRIKLPSVLRSTVRGGTSTAEYVSVKYFADGEILTACWPLPSVRHTTRPPPSRRAR